MFLYVWMCTYQHPPTQQQRVTNGGADSADQTAPRTVGTWCLEYVPCRLETFLSREGTLLDELNYDTSCSTVLVHVVLLIVSYPAGFFERVVVAVPSIAWAHPIGFSIYVVSDGSDDDVGGRRKHQGFSSQQQPSSVVTPYGELVGGNDLCQQVGGGGSVATRAVHASRSPLWGLSSLSNTTAEAHSHSANGVNGANKANIFQVTVTSEEWFRNRLQRLSSDSDGTIPTVDESLRNINGDLRRQHHE
jgi:hypothetical protein